MVSWPLQKHIWSLGKPKGRGLLGNKKKGLSLREGEHKKRKKKEKRGEKGSKKKEEIILSCYSSLERETIEKRK